MVGTFYLQERTASDSVLRDQVLRCGEWFDEPSPLVTVLTTAAKLLDHQESISGGLLADGVVKIVLERTLSNQEFLQFGASLGELIPEHPSVQDHVEDTFVLNARQQFLETDNVELQPFAENYITLHTEMSRLPMSRQPRYIVLMCEQPPKPDTGGQTILASMDAVHSELDSTEIEILQHTRYGPGHTSGQSPELSAAPSFLSYVDGRPVFSFRDFVGQSCEWAYDDSPDRYFTPEEVNETIYRLVVAMYQKRNIRGTRWSHAVIWIINNTRFFHGKTYCRIESGESFRWLKRLRIRQRTHLT